MRYFNTTGECDPADHYMLPAVERLPEARQWIEREEYFVIQAPRQSGKTTTLTALAKELTAEGRHVALRFSCETAGVGPDDIGLAEQRILAEIRAAAEGEGFPPEWMPPDPWPDGVEGRRIVKGLQAWAMRCPLPLVVLFDEIDVLGPDSLDSVLRQLREGFSWRPDSFPSSVGLCGMRRLSDHRVNNAVIRRMADFTAAEVAALYAQHTADTGQEFTPDAVALVYQSTRGQPWLVNAIAAEIIGEMQVPLTKTITTAHVEASIERIIEARPVHTDYLAAWLDVPSIRAVIEPIIAGTYPESLDTVFDEGVAQARDLGLVSLRDPLQVANPVYSNLIARALGDTVEGHITVDPGTLVLPDGRLDLPRLLDEFTSCWLEHSEWMIKATCYDQAGAELAFMAFLQRLSSGGDGPGQTTMDREFAIGSGSVNLLLRRPYRDGLQREAFELRDWRSGKVDPLKKAMDQFDQYLERLGLAFGTLVIFDRRDTPGPVSERSGSESLISPSGRGITLLRR